ncbi:FISUMP domain-containing protein [Dysgonomonas sp. 25]|uniref:FISUMP domain-containing protein n=1 Tax=Dysgonomonas sp. 25 TaxID=2302933 RepID=UPI0013D1DD2A|nr:FISUMP domain-containing protein [Dysgonomonas sp. 25]NDV70117.1 hypothetical protein [Dysgonomonas sp. 25]
MKRTILTQAILILAFLTTTIGLQAQVTIGSNQPPMKGALLDLTEGITTTKGLNLPRVELMNLKPITPAELSASIGGTGNWVLNDHIALVVYNTKADRCAIPEAIYEGLYVFDGIEWQYLGKKPESSPDVYYYEDLRPQLLGSQTYPYRQFGNAGIWMIENIRYIPTDNSITASAGNYSYTSKFYIYPNGDPYSAATAPATWNERQGLLYTYSAATLGKQDGVNQEQAQVAGTIPGVDEIESVYESSVGAKDGKIQGICPPNWHIPSDREWNELEKELYENAGKYSTYTIDELKNTTIWNPLPNAGNWNSAWEITIGYRGSSGSGGHGLAIQSECILQGSTFGNTGGKSLSTAQGGFNAMPVGFAYGGLTNGYGAQIRFWSASAYTNIFNAWLHYINNKQHYSQQIHRTADSRYGLYSVRCKKD